MKSLLLAGLLGLIASTTWAHRWTSDECGELGNLVVEISQYKESGEPAMQVKTKMLYVLHRAKAGTPYQDAEDLYILLAVVDAVYKSTEDVSELQMQIVGGCVDGRNRVGYKNG